MFNYLGCHGEKSKCEHGTWWMITFEDGSHDMVTTLKMALMLCRKVVRRA